MTRDSLINWASFVGLVAALVVGSVLAGGGSVKEMAYEIMGLFR